MTREISIRLSGFVKNTFVNITGKLPRGLVTLYRDINDVAKSLNIDFLVVGAMARDLVLVHGFGSTIERGTRDVDFGINVASWDDFETLKGQLVGRGFEQDKQKAHRLTRSDWDEKKASAMKLGSDAGVIALPPTRAFLKEYLFDQSRHVELLVRQMQGAGGCSLSVSAELLDVFVSAFLRQESERVCEYPGWQDRE